MSYLFLLPKLLFVPLNIVVQKLANPIQNYNLTNSPNVSALLSRVYPQVNPTHLQKYLDDKKSLIKQESERTTYHTSRVRLRNNPQIPSTGIKSFKNVTVTANANGDISRRRGY